MYRSLVWPQYVHHREAAAPGAEDADQVCGHGASAGGGEAERPYEPPPGQGGHCQRAAGQGPAEEREHAQVSRHLS